MSGSNGSLNASVFSWDHDKTDEELGYSLVSSINTISFMEHGKTNFKVSYRALLVISIVAEQSDRICPTCGGLSTGLIGTKIPPAALVAKILMTLSKHFGKKTATLSDFLRPSDKKERARVSISSFRSAYVNHRFFSPIAGQYGRICACTFTSW
jgi:hypothetical protein